MQSNVEIKICGINSFESAKASIGAEYIGFVFYQKSPRFLNAFDAREIATCLNPNQKKVGLFVNADINVIKHISEFVNLDMIQLHGDETINDIKAIKNSEITFFEGYLFDEGHQKKAFEKAIKNSTIKYGIIKILMSSLIN